MSKKRPKGSPESTAKGAANSGKNGSRLTARKVSGNIRRLNSGTFRPASHKSR